jgi:hypothetical protein
MNTTTAVMIIWMGVGSNETFDSMKFDSLDQCEATRARMAQAIGAKWNNSIRSYSDRFEQRSFCVDIPK